MTWMSVVMLSPILLSVIMLNGANNPTMQSVVMLIAVMLSVFKLNVFMLREREREREKGKK